MAVDKLVDSAQLDADLTSVANAIRTKGGTSAQLAFPSGFVSAVEAIPTGGGGGITKTEGNVTGNGSNTISIATDKAPDVFVIYREDLSSPTAISDRAAALSFLWVGLCCGSLYTAASSQNPANSGFTRNHGYSASAAPAAPNSVGYTNGNIYIKSGNNSNLWSTQLTYNYIFLFFQ